MASYDIEDYDFDHAELDLVGEAWEQDPLDTDEGHGRLELKGPEELWGTHRFDIRSCDFDVEAEVRVGPVYRGGSG
ncbi:MAG: hypothetical protein ACN0LA_12435 [Candidatus Longimicrobiales bacterium M2_2A_002]